MRVVVLHLYTKFEVRRPIRKIRHTMYVSVNGPGEPDFLTLKLVCESHQRWGTFLPNLCTLGLWVVELFAVYATDGQMDGRKDKSNECIFIIAPFHTAGGLIEETTAQQCTSTNVNKNPPIRQRES